MSSKKVTPAEETAATVAVVKVKKGPKMPIEEYLATLQGGEDSEEGLEGEEPAHGKIWHILKLYIRGYERADIIKAGYNKSTVYRQTKEYDNLRKAPATHYQGFEVFESRVRRVMSAKKLNREDAVEYIMGKDLE